MTISAPLHGSTQRECVWMSESKAWRCLKIEGKKTSIAKCKVQPITERQTCHNDNNDNNHDDMSGHREKRAE